MLFRPAKNPDHLRWIHYLTAALLVGVALGVTVWLMVR